MQKNITCTNCNHEFVIKTNKNYWLAHQLICPECGHRNPDDSVLNVMWDWEAHGMTPPPMEQTQKIYAVVNNYDMNREEEYYNQLTENLSRKIMDLVKKQDMVMDAEKLQAEINSLIQSNIPISVTYDWAMHSYERTQ